MKSKKSSAHPHGAEEVQYGLAKGWRSGISRGAVVILLVFIANLTFTILSLSKSQRFGYGQRVVFEGDCNKVKRLESSLHLVINILSTIILGASNYAMQCLSAPTRQEVDRAHQKRVWLDIGVLSLHNLRSINVRRTILWTFLALSSVPLHLFYNSTIYSSVYSRDYAIFMTTEDKLTANATSHTLGIDVNDADILVGYTGPQNVNHTTVGYYWDLIDATQNYTLVNLTSELYTSAMANTLTRLNTTECMNFYATPFPTNQGSLILVTSNATQTPYVSGYLSMEPIQDIYQQCPPDSFSWICHQIPTGGASCGQRAPCAEKRSQIDPSDWRPFGNKIDYCLSQTVEQKCILALSLPLIIVVMVFNMLKVALLLYTFWMVNDKPLMVLGDAIASFLEKADETTKGMCLLGSDDLREWMRTLSPAYSKKLKTVSTSKRRWNAVVSKTRWTLLMTLYITMLGICAILLFYGILGRVVSAATLMALPLGEVDPRTFIEGWSVPSFGASGLLSNVFVANSPQLLLSMIYFTYNGLFTVFLLGSEWNSFSNQRKGLRVSEHPSGNQRATYFLQLPFRWAILLMSISAVLHWLCSQSIFLVSIEFDHTVFQFSNIYGSMSCGGVANNIPTDLTECYDQYFTCGYSPVAILTTILLGIVMIMFAILASFISYGNGSMPIAASCSAAISASCHMLDEDDPKQQNETGLSAATSRLQWGEFDTPLLSVTDVHAVDDESKEQTHMSQHVYHCGFSPNEVNLPVESKLYA